LPCCSYFFLKGEPKKRKILLVAVLRLGNLVALLPWGIITFSETGGFVPLSSQGPLSVVVGVIWLSGPGTKEVKEILSDDVMDLIERVKTEDLSSFFKLSRFFGQELINRPVPLLKLIGLKLVRSWYGTSTRWYEEREILAVQILYLIAGFLGLIIYVIKTAKTKTRDMIFLLGPVFYFWMMAFFSVSIMRYMIPAMGLIIIFSAITVSILIDKIKFSLK